MEELQHRPRRAYKRFPAEIWNKHKETVRQLFLGQDKTYKEVVSVLSEHHGLTVGERQLKRKTEEWGFFKNIPSREMDKMVRTRRQRREKLGRPTKFRRKHGDGEFHLVPNSKLALHERRMEPVPGSPSSPLSTCSSLPSNIECYTPSDLAASPPCTDVETTPTTPTTAVPVPKPSLPSAQPVQVAARLSLDGQYAEAAHRFRQLSRLTASSPWGSVLYEFNAEIMDVARHGACPETLGARVSDTLSRYLFHEREKHRNMSIFSVTAARENNEALKKVSSGLQMNAKFWGTVVVLQRVLQLWEPILGPDHPKIIAVRENLALKRRATIVNLDAFRPSLVQSKGPLEVFEEFDRELSQIETTVEEGVGLLCLGDGPLDQFRVKLEAITEQQPRIGSSVHDRAMMRFGRSRALLGMLYSFGERYVDAQSAFHDSAETMRSETCLEIKLHRMLWDAEHRTRIWDWEGAWKIVGEARTVFVEADESSSPFFVRHFTDRFAVLRSAIEQRMSVDRVSALGDVDDLRDQVDGFHLPDAADGPSGLESRERGIKPTIGNGTGVDVEAWRNFVYHNTSSA